eukprot:2238658-Rhodomonas_salina.5
MQSGKLVLQTAYRWESWYYRQIVNLKLSGCMLRMFGLGFESVGRLILKPGLRRSWISCADRTGPKRNKRYDTVRNAMLYALTMLHDARQSGDR